MRTLTLLLIASVCVIAADLDNNTVTVTATRPISVQADQVQVLVDLLATQDTGLDDILAKLKGAGITAANLVGVSGNAVVVGFPLATTPVSRWTFQSAVSLSD